MAEFVFFMLLSMKLAPDEYFRCFLKGVLEHDSIFTPFILVRVDKQVWKTPASEEVAETMNRPIAA